MTRAQELLYITYSRSSTLVNRAVGLKECSEHATFPDDFTY
jgi:hypothetical protein